MASVNGSYLHCTDREILVNSSLKATTNKIGYCPLKNPGERSRAILALLNVELLNYSELYITVCDAFTKTNYSKMNFVLMIVFTMNNSVIKHVMCKIF